MATPPFVHLVTGSMLGGMLFIHFQLPLQAYMHTSDELVN